MVESTADLERQGTPGTAYTCFPRMSFTAFIRTTLLIGLAECLYVFTPDGMLVEHAVVVASGSASSAPVGSQLDSGTY